MSLLAAGANHALTLAGNVTALFNGGFQIQGGPGVGYLHVFTNATTTFSGRQPYLGEAVEVSGTGSTSTSLTAVSVNELLTITGPVDALLPGGFHMHGPRGQGYMRIFTSGATVYTGARPYVGETLTVAGTGSFRTSLAAVTVSQTVATTTSPTGSSTPAPNAPGVLSVTGPIDQVMNGGFHMHGPRGIGYLRIFTTAATNYAGARPYVGETVTATGTGSYRTSLTATTVTQVGAPPATPAPVTNAPPPTAFMPSSWGRISAAQVFDETNTGFVSSGRARADGALYDVIWGARPGLAPSWSARNPGLVTSYYDTLETDASPTAWGGIGHGPAWWNANHPDWVLYKCTMGGAPTMSMASVPGLDNVPLDIHNPAVVDYQVRLLANYAHAEGYNALAIDEATFWQVTAGGYGCAIRRNGAFVTRYASANDPQWTADVIAWVKQAHTILTTDPVIAPYHLKLIVNHPANNLTPDEKQFLAYVDADLDEDGYSYYGTYVKGSAADFTRTTDWTTYAQQHGVAVVMLDNWGSVRIGAAQTDYSLATYLMGDEQAESLFSTPGTGYGQEQWHAQYQTNVGPPCGDYYSAADPSNPSIYFRRFANAVVVVNGGSGGAPEIARLPAGHAYTDVMGRPVSNPLTVQSNDGYVLLTANGCT